MFNLLFASLTLFFLSTTMADNSKLLMNMEKNLYISKIKDFNNSLNLIEINVKQESLPFVMGQGLKTKTVVLFHGLSDSPGSMKEIANVYFYKGYNVVSLLLRDHGLISKLRKKARKSIKLSQWREDVDKSINYALALSNTEKISVVGYSLGGALAVDAVNRFPKQFNSLVLVSPMLRIKFSKLASLTKYFKLLFFSTKKGIKEMPHFYPDIALNQTAQAYKLTKTLRREVKNPSRELLSIPKLLFLTDSDTTINNKYALKYLSKIGILKINTILFHNDTKELSVLHRDMPMKSLNANGRENPHLKKMMDKIDRFIE